MNKFTMVIPSYWGRSRGNQGGQGGEQVVFDHPTRLDEEGTLGRLLESLDVFDLVAGRIVVISVANEEQIAGQVQTKVDEIIRPYRSRYDIVNFGTDTLAKVRENLTAGGLGNAALELVNLNSYAAVRNMCALAGILDGSEYTIFIDDDELFTDTHFLRKIDENMGREINGETITALAGYYLQPDTYRLDNSNVPAWRRPYWNNTAVMNTAFDKIIGRGERLKPTPFVFGGNMTISRQVLRQVPFDPQITRGEDIDFLLNLRIAGITFYLDRELAIKHLPPPSQQKPWKKLSEDAIRFLYDRKKVQDHAVLDPARLQPYPGQFLGDDLPERIVKTSELLRQELIAQGNEQGSQECEKIAAMVKENQWGQIDTGHG